MSYEAWGSPPDPEPTFCPACGNERHEEVNDCPLDMMYQRALAAESKNAELLAALKEVVAFWDAITMEDAVNEIHVKARAALAAQPAAATVPDLLPVLIEARQALQYANDNQGGPINDTIWMMHRPETLFDFMDAAIESAKAAQAQDDGETR